MSIDAGALQSTKLRNRLRRDERARLVRENTKNSSALKPLRAPELRRETQCIVLQYPTAETAAEQGTTARAVENQKNGDSSLSLLAVVNWCRANPRVRAQFMALMGCDSETDPDFVEALSLLVQAQMRKAASDPCESGAGAGSVDGNPPPDGASGDLFGELR